VALAAVAGLPADQGVRRSTSDGVDLTGGVGRRLAGDAFIGDWRGIALDRLLDRIIAMPPGGPRLGESDQSSLLAYILDFNGFPNGEVPLNAEIARAVSIADHRSQETAPESGLIQAVGCLTRSPERQWMLTDAADPVRTKDPNASSESARELLAQTSRGTRAYRLLNAYPAPERFEGQRVEVKGLLIRGAADSLNVTAIAVVAAECR
jgi:hypothetical protein